MCDNLVTSFLWSSFEELMSKYSLKTNSVTVVVEPKYEEEHSKPEYGQFVFSYAVGICNESNEVIQITRRSWIITDAFMNREHVEGEGIVGEQPIILPGAVFNYKSFCPLKTSFGTMKGAYYATTASGKSIKITIPEFILAHPFAVQ
jgi:ApaG protein